MTQYRITRKLALLSAVIPLSACSAIGSAPGMNRLVGDEGVFRDRGGEYLEAESIPRMVIPAGLDDFMIDDLLIVPEVNIAEGQAFLEVPRPRPLSGNVERSVLIQSMDDERWIVVQASASQVWPRIRQFWLTSNVSLAMENPANGLLETVWFSMDNRPTREKFRITVVPGFQNNSAEVSIRHLSSDEADASQEQVVWPERSSDPELESQVLGSLSTYLAQVAGLYQTSSVSLMASNIPSRGRAVLTESRDGNYLRLEAGYLRSWAAVGRALERMETEISSEDFDTGVYQVVFNPAADERPGFFRRMAGAERRNRHALTVQLLETGDVVEVRVADSSGSVPAEVRNGLIQRIRDNIF